MSNPSKLSLASRLRVCGGYGMEGTNVACFCKGSRGADSTFAKRCLGNVWRVHVMRESVEGTCVDRTSL